MSRPVTPLAVLTPLQPSAPSRRRILPLHRSPHGQSSGASTWTSHNRTFVPPALARSVIRVPLCITAGARPCVLTRRWRGKRDKGPTGVSGGRTPRVGEEGRLALAASPPTEELANTKNLLGGRRLLPRLPLQAQEDSQGKNNGNATAKHGGNKDDDFPSSDDMDTYEDDSISSTDNLTIPSFIDVIPKDVSSTYEDVFSSETREYEGTSEKRAAELGQEPDSVKANVAPRSGKKSGRKIGSHVAEPYQSQGSSKMVSENSKSKVKLNKSTGDHVCKPCSRTFVTDMALQAHRSAKHH